MNQIEKYALPIWLALGFPMLGLAQTNGTVASAAPTVTTPGAGDYLLLFTPGVSDSKITPANWDAWFLSLNNAFSGSNWFGGNTTFGLPPLGSGNSLTNLNGANLALATVNSNKLDAATLALIGSGGGIGAATATNIAAYQANLATNVLGSAAYAAAGAFDGAGVGTTAALLATQGLSGITISAKLGSTVLGDPIQQSGTLCNSVSGPVNIQSMPALTANAFLVAWDSGSLNLAFCQSAPPYVDTNGDLFLTGSANMAVNWNGKYYGSAGALTNGSTNLIATTGASVGQVLTVLASGVSGWSNAPAGVGSQTPITQMINYAGYGASNVAFESLSGPWTNKGASYFGSSGQTTVDASGNIGGTGSAVPFNNNIAPDFSHQFSGSGYGLTNQIFSQSANWSDSGTLTAAIHYVPMGGGTTVAGTGGGQYECDSYVPNYGSPKGILVTNVTFTIFAGSSWSATTNIAFGIYTNSLGGTKALACVGTNICVTTAATAATNIAVNVLIPNGLYWSFGIIPSGALAASTYAAFSWTGVTQ